MSLRTLIIDDEPPARRRLRQLAKADPRIEIIGEATDGLDALEQIETLTPDLVFLDIQMPGMTGFEVLENLSLKRPDVIFTTAYDQYAIRAFEVRAVDYLLKPFDAERLREAVSRVTSPSRPVPQMDEFLQTVRPKYVERILIRERQKRIVLPISDVIRIQAEEKYVRLITGRAEFLHRESILSLERKLDPEAFVRTHRSHIVRIDAIREIAPWSKDNLIVILKNGSQAPVGKQYRARLLGAFQ